MKINFVKKQAEIKNKKCPLQKMNKVSNVFDIKCCLLLRTQYHYYRQVIIFQLFLSLDEITKHLIKTIVSEEDLLLIAMTEKLFCLLQLFNEVLKIFF
jgi:hypothetical protein